MSGEAVAPPLPLPPPPPMACCASGEGPELRLPPPMAICASAEGRALRSESPQLTRRRGVASLSNGSASFIGMRDEMEDRLTEAPSFVADEYDFYGVYDGHGGAQVAEACKDRMHIILAEEVSGALQDGPEQEALWRQALMRSFARVDGEVADLVPVHGITVGSTAAVAVVGTRMIVVANCGDSRAVLSRGGAVVPLSTDHKPESSDEQDRIEKAGGCVVSWNGYRVLGVLATSRSIGDYMLKPCVISEPEIMVVDRNERDEFLILGTDGLWDVVSNEVACKVVRRCLSGWATKTRSESVVGHSASEAATILAKLAISRGSRDNISVVVVELRKLRCRRKQVS